MSFPGHGFPRLLPGSSHGSLVGWRESSCFCSGSVHCSGPRQHSGSSEASREMMHQKVLCNGQSPLQKGRIVGCSWWNSDYLAGVDHFLCSGKVPALCPCWRCSSTRALRWGDRYSHHCFVNGEPKPKGRQRVKGRVGFSSWACQEERAFSSERRRGGYFPRPGVRLEAMMENCGLVTFPL